MVSYKFLYWSSMFFLVANVKDLGRVVVVIQLAGSPGRLKQVVDRNEEKIR